MSDENISSIFRILTAAEQNQVSEKMLKTLDDSLNEGVDELADKMKRSAKPLIMKLLGFSSRWGEWEIDHCNGRSGNSPIGSELENVLKPVAKNIVNMLLKELQFSDVEEMFCKKDLIKIDRDIKRKYRSYFMQEIEYQTEFLKEQARKDAAEFFPHLVMMSSGKTVDELRHDLIVAALTQGDDDD